MCDNTYRTALASLKKCILAFLFVIQHFRHFYVPARSFPSIVNHSRIKPKSKKRIRANLCVFICNLWRPVALYRESASRARKSSVNLLGSDRDFSRLGIIQSALPIHIIPVGCDRSRERERRRYIPIDRDFPTRRSRDVPWSPVGRARTREHRPVSARGATRFLNSSGLRVKHTNLRTFARRGPDEIAARTRGRMWRQKAPAKHRPTAAASQLSSFTLTHWPNPRIDTPVTRIRAHAHTCTPTHSRDSRAYVSPPPLSSPTLAIAAAAIAAAAATTAAVACSK